MYLGNVQLGYWHFIEKLAINHNDTLWLRCLGIGAQRNEGYSDGCFAVLCVFSSCSKNDDGKGGSASIIGTWRVVSEEGYEIYYGEKDEWNEVYSEEYYYTLTFNKSGRGYAAERYDGLIKDEDNFTWKLSGNKLTIHFEGESEGETGKIEMLTAKTLVLSYEWVDGDDRGYSKITCTFVGRE